MYFGRTLLHPSSFLLLPPLPLKVLVSFCRFPGEIFAYVGMPFSIVLQGNALSDADQIRIPPPGIPCGHEGNSKHFILGLETQKSKKTTKEGHSKIQ